MKIKIAFLLLLMMLSIVALFAGGNRERRVAQAEEAEQAEQVERSQGENVNTQVNYEIATLGGGCFWCVEAVYEPIEGVVKAVSGYAGGGLENPSYQQVVSGRSGHAEVVQLHYDPAKVTYEQVLKLFFRAHDPTTLNRQGYDVGTQYRSIILTHSSDQQVIAEKVISEEQKEWTNPIVTEIQSFTNFYEAEEYHQDFYANNPNYGYCAAVIRPKLKKLGLENVDEIKVLDLKL